MPITSKTAPIYKLGIALESNYEFNTFLCACLRLPVTHLVGVLINNDYHIISLEKLNSTLYRLDIDRK
jgi:hypothetical protein